MGNTFGIITGLCKGADLDDVFRYDTPKLVRIRYAVVNVQRIHMFNPMTEVVQRIQHVTLHLHNIFAADRKLGMLHYALEWGVLIYIVYALFSDHNYVVRTVRV